jgi:hypothetical protein
MIFHCDQLSVPAHDRRVQQGLRLASDTLRLSESIPTLPTIRNECTVKRANVMIYPLSCLNGVHVKDGYLKICCRLKRLHTLR